MTPCPSDELLAGLADGALAETERSDLELHVADCAPCAQLVAELARTSTADGVAGPETIGRYELAAAVGSGGMGLVLEAWDPVLARRVAIKVVRPDKAIGRARMLAEARALAQLADPHVLAIYDVLDAERGVCLVMELVDGDSAAAWRERVRPAWPAIRGVYLQVARGVMALHARGLLHRDIKPANVLVGRDGRARLADFGLAGESGAGARGGTVGFMAPEQASGGASDARADQYALAMAMIHAASGDVVPAGTEAAALATRGVPAAAAGALARAIAAAPADRHADVAAFVAALEATPRRGRRWWLAGGGIVMAVVAAVLVTRGGPAPAARNRADREAALSAALAARDADGCARALAALVEVEPRAADHAPYCAAIAGRCAEAAAALRALPGAAVSGLMNDYCAPDGDLATGRVARALAQGPLGRNPASCRRRATWATTLATTPADAQMFEVNAIECFAAIGRCADAATEAAALAKLTGATGAAELARVAPRCRSAE